MNFWVDTFQRPERVLDPSNVIRPCPFSVTINLRLSAWDPSLGSHEPASLAVRAAVRPWGQVFTKSCEQREGPISRMEPQQAAGGLDGAPL